MDLVTLTEALPSEGSENAKQIATQGNGCLYASDGVATIDGRNIAAGHVESLLRVSCKG
jgi:hypothetical protein